VSDSEVTDDIVRALAVDLGWRVTDAELTVYRDRLSTQAESLRQLFPVGAGDETMGALRSGDGQREWWPSDADSDPLRLFTHRCTVRTAPAGPLAGQTIALKDNIALASVPMTLGSRAMADFVPDYDATVVSRLLDAGAIIVGKTNMYEFSLGDVPSGFGRTLNPRDTTRETGGSSSGSAAAVACGAVDIALGGDQGGSIRVPAAWCGVVGLKATFGLVPHTGVVGADPSIDFVGPMAATVADVALALDVIAGPDGLDPRQTGYERPRSYTDGLDDGPRDVTVGVLVEGFTEDTDPGVRRELERTVAALARSGARVREVSVPRHADAATAWLPIWLEGTRYMAATGFGAAFHQGWYPTRLVQHMNGLLARDEGLPLNLKQNAIAGEYLRRLHQGSLYARAQNLRHTLSKGYDDVLSDVDCLVMPTTPNLPPEFVEPSDEAETVDFKVFGGGGLRLTDIVANTAAFNYTGHPALTLPCGEVDGLPVGMQVVGSKFAESTVLRLASAIEAITKGVT
jgi:amidase